MLFLVSMIYHHCGALLIIVFFVLSFKIFVFSQTESAKRILSEKCSGKKSSVPEMQKVSFFYFVYFFFFS
jgi:hypothetical protein